MNVLGGALALAVSILLQPAAPATVRFALVVGNNVPDSKDLPTLRFADDDALATHRLFLEAGIHSTLLTVLDAETASAPQDVLPTGPASLAALRAQFAVLQTEMLRHRKAGDRVEFILYYSGHGNVRRGEGYVVLEDGPLTRTALWEDLLAQSPAHFNHVMVDACQSYFLALQRGVGGQRAKAPMGFSSGAARPVRARTGLLLSTSSAQDSHEWERYRAGIFSHELRSALRGGADLNVDGIITYDEVGAFLLAANRGVENSRFRPDFLVIPPQDQDAHELVQWGGGDTLLLDVPDAGHLSVEDASGARVMDVHVQTSLAPQLHLPPSRPLYVRRESDGVELVLPDHGSATYSSLAAHGSTVLGKGGGHQAFERLFSAPLSLLDVEAWARQAALAVQLEQPAALPTWAAFAAGIPLGGLSVAASVGAVVLGSLAGTLVLLDVAQGWRPGSNLHFITAQQAWTRDGAAVGSVVCVLLGMALAAGAAGVAALWWWTG